MIRMLNSLVNTMPGRFHLRPELVRPFVGVVAACVMLTGVCPDANAGPNEITLQRFGECVEFQGAPCAGTRTDDAEFRAFARELGVAFAPYGVAPAETTGAAGFALSIDHHITSLNSDEEYWQKAMVEGDAPSVAHVSQLHLRKGLPYSFEIGAMTSVWWGSDLVAFGGEFKWALHEDTLWPVPNLSLRGWGNVVLGSRQLRLYNAGFDALLGVPFGIGGAVQVTPFVGYSMHLVISGSQLIDATPGDNTPTVIDTNDPSRNNNPEFLFETESEMLHRLIAGLRIRITHLELTGQIAALEDQLTISFGLGATF